jgi:lipopolysaccharide biosynthesis glycosyltransferase
MKIDRILVACCKNDFYLTRICIASIRYWNKSIPIDLLKDYSAGNFDTQELEKVFSVGIMPLPFKSMNAYSKLYPFVSPTDERVLVLDSDIILLGDIIPYLEQFSGNMLVQAYRPKVPEEEMGKWFFKMDARNPIFKEYVYPGFLFNSGQMVIDTGIFPLEEVKKVVQWSDHTQGLAQEVFLCQDQGIINFLFAKLLDQKKISYAAVSLFEWGWTYDQQRYSLSNVKNKQGHPLLLHWYGEKKGLLFSLPQNELLYFFEQQYYKNLKLGIFKLMWERLTRTIKHFDVFVYQCLKNLHRLIFYK